MRALLQNLRGGAFSALVALQSVCAAGAVAADSGAVAGENLFEKTCAACHGSGGAGGARAPRLAGSAHVLSLTDTQIRSIITNGTSGGMPAFKLPAASLT